MHLFQDVNVSPALGNTSAEVRPSRSQGQKEHVDGDASKNRPAEHLQSVGGRQPANGERAHDLVRLQEEGEAKKKSR